MKRSRSSQYITTIPNTPEGLKVLANMRAENKLRNKNIRAGVAQPVCNGLARIMIFGRLGEENPNAWKYRTGRSNAYQYIAKEDAAHFDVYVHPLYGWWAPYGR
jgi:hypothetical protein